VCADGYVKFDGRCVAQGPVAAGFVAGTVLLLLAAFVLFSRRQQRKNDKVWRIKREDVEFDTGRRELGRGAFGVVLLASYRGTLVAVKMSTQKPGKGLQRYGGEIVLFSFELTLVGQEWLDNPIGDGFEVQYGQLDA